MNTKGSETSTQEQMHTPLMLLTLFLEMKVNPFMLLTKLRLRLQEKSKGYKQMEMSECSHFK